MRKVRTLNRLYTKFFVVFTISIFKGLVKLILTTPNVLSMGIVRALAISWESALRPANKNAIRLIRNDFGPMCRLERFRMGIRKARQVERRVRIVYDPFIFSAKSFLLFKYHNFRTPYA